MALQQVNSSIENTKFQMGQIQEAISALKKWEVEFNTYLAGVDSQSKQLLASTEELKVKEQQLDAEINAENQRQVDFQDENARDAQAMSDMDQMKADCSSELQRVLSELENLRSEKQRLEGEIKKGKLISANYDENLTKLQTSQNE